MKNLKWYIALVLVLVMSQMPAKANEVDNILSDKLIEYVGVCRLGKRGELVFNDKDTKSIPECIVGFEKGNKDERWVVILRGRKPQSIILMNLKEKTQKIIWAANMI
jgi:hypothetical protein